tara:strand:- start:348 stop:527 length:180 start_codon:yes stop_codon:yes gene_type:complete
MWFHAYTIKKELKKCKSVDEKLNKLINLQMDGKLKKKDFKGIKKYNNTTLQQYFKQFFN